jgi:threonine dehydrogenase-like Zn-dependent dehydrogenase
VVQGARIAGAARIFVVDPVELKRKAAAGFGATDLVDPAAGDPVAQIKEATGGRGADYAFEVIGLPETIHQAYNTARRGGTVVVVGMPNADATVTFSAFQLFLEEKRTLGCFYGFGAYRRRLISSGKRPSVAAVAVGHRAHRLAFAMLRSQEPYNPKRWAAAVADGSVMAKTGGRPTRTT